MPRRVGGARRASNQCDRDACSRFPSAHPAMLGARRAAHRGSVDRDLAVIDRTTASGGRWVGRLRSTTDDVLRHLTLEWEGGRSGGDDWDEELRHPWRRADEYLAHQHGQWPVLRWVEVDDPAHGCRHPPAEGAAGAPRGPPPSSCGSSAAHQHAARQLPARRWARRRPPGYVASDRRWTSPRPVPDAPEGPPPGSGPGHDRLPRQLAQHSPTTIRRWLPSNRWSAAGRCAMMRWGPSPCMGSDCGQSRASSGRRPGGCAG